MQPQRRGLGEPFRELRIETVRRRPCCKAGKILHHVRSRGLSCATRPA